MAVQGTDKLMVQRGAILYRTTAQEIADLTPTISVIDTLLSSSSTAALSANQGRLLKNLIDGLGDITPTATITTRNALTGLDPGDLIHVLDDGDGKWARYQVTSTTDGTWGNSVSVKVGDQDWSGAAATNLGYTAAPAQGTITNTNGTTAVIPLADATNAGLFAPAERSKVGFLTVTSATDLDAMRVASHAAVTLTGSATTNPLTLTGQVLGFDIAQLALAP